MWGGTLDQTERERVPFIAHGNCSGPAPEVPPVEGTRGWPGGGHNFREVERESRFVEWLAVSESLLEGVGQ